MWVVDKAPTPLDYALAYAELGWYVLPVWSVDEHGQCRCGRPNTEKGHKAGKHPQADLVPHGHQDATVDPKIIRDWWATDPDAGIGISLADSGLLALDIDPQNGGVESLAAIEAEHGVMFSDCAAVTQGGGEHRIFTADSSVSYPGTLDKGLDLKHHGYICVAPTLGPSGDYRWAAGHSPISKSRPVKPSPLPSLIASKGREHVDYSLTERGGVPVATAQTFDDIRSALKHVDADDYTTWVNVGMVLKPYGENGYRVWTEWSANSDKFDAAANRRKWERDISAPHSITYRSIFKMAIDNGWSGNNNDVTRSSSSVSAEDHPLSLSKAFPSGVDSVTCFEYIFDDFMSTGVNVVAGAPGVGKTTLIVPLALAAAHLCPAEFALKPTVRRNVIIITESVVQVQRTIYSLYNWGFTGQRPQEFNERVRVIASQRLDPKIVAQVSEEYRTWTVDNDTADGGVYKALPLVVFDTANAVFDLENENDNAEVGKVMAYVKQSFDGFPIIIVSHTAKINGMVESEHLGPRGASAWTGDAQGVYAVFKDGDTEDSPRMLKTVKVRFPTQFDEMAFDLVSNKERHKDVLGFDKDIWFSHSVARPLKRGERGQLREEAKEERNQKEIDRISKDIIAFILREPNQSRSFYERTPESQGGVRGSQDRKEKAITRMLDDGILARLEYTQPKGRATHYLMVDVEVLESEDKGRFGV